MTTEQQTRILVRKSSTYREGYANSVQVRASMWDFFLVFGIIAQEAQEEAIITNEQGIFLSPQQAKALWNLLGQNLAQYEETFGSLSLEAKPEVKAQAVQ